MPEAIEAKGATLLFSPPYSPDLNPIEMAWSKIKANVRKLRPWCLDHLVEATATALEPITGTDRLNWIVHALEKMNSIG